MSGLSTDSLKAEQKVLNVHNSLFLVRTCSCPEACELCNACTHKATHECTYMNTHAHVLALAHMHKRENIHACQHTHVYAPALKFVHLLTRAHTRAHTHTHMYVRAHCFHAGMCLDPALQASAQWQLLEAAQQAEDASRECRRQRWHRPEPFNPFK